MNLFLRALPILGLVALSAPACGEDECSSAAVLLELELEPPAGVSPEFDVEVVGALTHEASVLRVRSSDGVTAAATISGATPPGISASGDVRMRLVAGTDGFIDGRYVEISDMNTGALLFAAYAGAPLTVAGARVQVARELACEVTYDNESYGIDHDRFYRVVATVDGATVTANAGAIVSVDGAGLVVDHQGTFEREIYELVNETRTAVLVYAADN